MPLTIEDKLEIMELAGRYNFAIDRCLPEEWANVFTEDGQVWADGNFRAAGRHQLEEYMRTASRAGENVRHFPSNAVIEEGDDGNAKLRMYVLTWDLAGGGLVPRFMGEYDDILVKIGGKWKFKVRQVTQCAGIPLAQLSKYK